jgi:hypothetical protein
VWSPVAGEYAFVTDRGGSPEIRLRSEDSGWERTLVSSKDFDSYTSLLGDLAFAPNGQSIAYYRLSEGQQSIWISTTAGEPPVRLNREKHSRFERGPAWSPDGNWIAYFTSRNGQYALMKARVGSNSKPEIVRAGAGMFPAWSPKGDWIVCVRPDSGLNLVSKDGSQIRQIGTGRWYRITWTGDGRQLVGLKATADQRLVMASVSPGSGAETIIVNLGRIPAAFRYASWTGADPVQGFSISRDGRTVLFSAFEVQSDLWLLKGLVQPGILNR